MARSKDICVVLAVTSLLAGCLFPSFEDLGGQQPAVLTKDAGNDATKADDGGGATPQTDSATPPSGDAGSAPPLAIACGSKSCDPAVDDCCFTLGGPNCQPHGAAGTCGLQGEGQLLSCDGAEDCTGGDVCCYVPGDKKASCKAATACGNGKILCNGPQQLCGAGQGNCTGTVTISSESYKVCQ